MPIQLSLEFQSPKCATDCYCEEEDLPLQDREFTQIYTAHTECLLGSRNESNTTPSFFVVLMS